MTSVQSLEEDFGRGFNLHGHGSLPGHVTMIIHKDKGSISYRCFR